MKNKRKLISIICLPLMALTSCASYKATSLGNLSSEIMTSPSTSEKVLFGARAFTKEDCRRYLDRNVISKGYQPIQVYIQNNSDASYNFSLDRIGLPCVRSDEVADTVHTSTVGRAVGYGVGALFLWPLAIPAIVDGIKSSEANTSLDNDFSDKTAKNQIIHPYSTLNKIIFVPVSGFVEKIA